MRSELTLFAPQRTPERTRKELRYLVWEKDGLLHKLCLVAPYVKIAKQIGHTGEWLSNVLAGRKVILFKDMRAMGRVLADFHGKKEAWDTRELFPDHHLKEGVTVYRKVGANDLRNSRVVLRRDLFPKGGYVKVTALEVFV